jgi:acyl carrier protein
MTDPRHVTLQRLVALSARRFGRAPEALGGDTDIFESLGVDSVHLLELLSELEREWGIEIPDYELRGVKTFSDLAGVIQRRL